MENLTYDGHVHTPFCPHGNSAPFEEYIERAIAKGFKGLSFCEHAPLPPSFPDPTPKKDSGMALSDVESYIKTIENIRDRYANDINIRIGLEIDFIEGFEQETRTFLDRYGHALDDGVLSVHFIKAQETYGLLDYNVQTFESLAKSVGGVKHLVQRYYETVLHSIHADLGPYKPSRLGHVSLVRKFQKEVTLPPDEHWLLNILTATQKAGFALDINGAGVCKPLCKEPYPPVDVIQKATDLGIPLVYGSDAHHPDDLGQGREALLKMALGQPATFPNTRS